MRLLNGPWIDSEDLPRAVKEQAAQRILNYWRVQAILVIVGELILWFAAYEQNVTYSRAYLIPPILIGFAYVMCMFRNFMLLWLLIMVAMFALQGMLMRGLGSVTAISYMLPYTFAMLLLPSRQRVLVQACCVVGFWFSLFYEALPLAPQLLPPRLHLVSYNILMATLTFQTLRFLNRLAVELNAAYVAQEVTQRSQQFLARVSHELRTPLNSVLGFAKMLRRGAAKFTPTQASYLEQIVEEGEQLNHLVSDLLDSAQLSAGKLRLTMESCDVNTVCRAVSDEIRALLKPGVALTLDLTPTLPSIQADAFRLRQIVRNLVSNAAKYTAQGEICIQTVLRGSHVHIHVRDTGPGIPQDEQTLVFVPFVKRDNRSPGVGLGLDIALQLAKLHGGTIRLISEVGIGSTFTVELPA
jgi:signal transduction histidine kinase